MLLQGASRESYAEANDRLDALLGHDRDPGSRVALAESLFDLTTLLDDQPALRRALADPAVEPDRKRALVDAVFSGRVGGGVLELLQALSTATWSHARDLTDTLEELAAGAAFAAAEAGGTLDDVEDELFRFGRVVDAQPALRRALEDRALPVDRKQAVVDTLLEGRAQPVTRLLVDRIVTAPRGRSVTDALEDYARLAARRRQRYVAEVTVARPLPPDQADRLAAALARLYGRAVDLQVSVDPDVLGGVRVQVGDEVIDGTVASRLNEAAQRLTGRQ